MDLDRIVHTVTCAAEEAARRVQKGAIVGCVLAALGVTAFGFATTAFYLALAAEMRPVFACLAVAGAYLAVALVILLLARMGKGRKPARRPEHPPPPAQRQPEPDAVSELIATFLAGIRAGREGFRRQGSRRDDR